MQALARDNFIKPTSRQKRSARTVLLRMAADQERADRIRQVRQDKHLRWKQIAAYVGVEMRSAQMWQETGAISWDNAVKFAELAGVDAHWLMSGSETSTPDLFAGANSADSSLEARLADLSDQIARDREERDANISDMKTLIAQQSTVLSELTDAVRDLRDTVATQQDATRRLDDVAQQIVRERGGTALEASPQRPGRARTKTARSGSPAASK